MNLIDTMQEQLTDFSKNERKVADFFIAHPYEAQRLGVDAAADRCGVSRSTIIRFCHKLGFKGYSEFRYTLISQDALPAADDDIQSSVAERYFECFTQIAASLSGAQREHVAEMAYRSNRVICLGELHSGMSAQQMAFRLNRIGMDAYAICDMTIADRYSKILSPADMVILFSISGTREYPDLLREYRKSRASIVLVTMTKTAPCTPFADEVVLLPSALLASRHHILDEAPAFFFAIELLIEAISHKMSTAVPHPQAEPLP